MALEHEHGTRRRRVNPNLDYYAILQVHPAAHLEIIKRAYRVILSVLGAHPDVGGSLELTIQVNEAYDVLSDPAARREYDAARRRHELRLQLQQHPYRGLGSSGHHHNEGRTVHCSHCGARNRLPATIDPRHAVCGRCRTFLGGGW